MFSNVDEYLESLDSRLAESVRDYFEDFKTKYHVSDFDLMANIDLKSAYNVDATLVTESKKPGEGAVTIVISRKPNSFKVYIHKHTAPEGFYETHIMAIVNDELRIIKGTSIAYDEEGMGVMDVPYYYEIDGNVILDSKWNLVLPSEGDDITELLSTHGFTLYDGSSKYDYSEYYKSITINGTTVYIMYDIECGSLLYIKCLFGDTLYTSADVVFKTMFSACPNMLDLGMSFAQVFKITPDETFEINSIGYTYTNEDCELLSSARIGKAYTFKGRYSTEYKFDDNGEKFVNDFKIDILEDGITRLVSSYKDGEVITYQLDNDDTIKMVSRGDTIITKIDNGKYEASMFKFDGGIKYPITIISQYKTESTSQYMSLYEYNDTYKFCIPINQHEHIVFEYFHNFYGQSISKDSETYKSKVKSYVDILDEMDTHFDKDAVPHYKKITNIIRNIVNANMDKSSMGKVSDNIVYVFTDGKNILEITERLPGNGPRLYNISCKFAVSDVHDGLKNMELEQDIMLSTTINFSKLSDTGDVFIIDGNVEVKLETEVGTAYLSRYIFDKCIEDYDVVDGFKDFLETDVKATGNFVFINKMTHTNTNSTVLPVGIITINKHNIGMISNITTHRIPHILSVKYNRMNRMAGMTDDVSITIRLNEDYTNMFNIKSKTIDELFTWRHAYNYNTGRTMNFNLEIRQSYSDPHHILNIKDITYGHNNICVDGKIKRYLKISDQVIQPQVPSVDIRFE